MKKEKEEQKGVEKVAPDGGWGWMVVLGVSLVNMSTRPIEPSFGLLFGDILTKLSVATTGAGIIVSSYEAVVNFSGLLVGPLIKKYSYRKVSFVGSLLCGFGLILTYPASSMAHILITYGIINGLGVGFSWSSTFVSLNHYFKKKRGQAVGMTMTGTGLGLLLMPQAVRYLTEEYDFQGSILILGAFALNSCVGSSLLQPIKWHLKTKKTCEKCKKTIEKEFCDDCGNKIVLEKQDDDKIDRKTSYCPQITISQAIEENDENEEDEDGDRGEMKPLKEIPVLDPRKQQVINRPRFYLKAERKYSLIEKGNKFQPDSPLSAGVEQRKFSFNSILNKSSTEPKFDKYFDEVGLQDGSCEIVTSKTSVNNNNNSSSFRKRKGSTISNLSNMDFHASCLHIHAIEAENKEMEEGSKKKMDREQSKTGGASYWQRFASFMDLDLLKDPIYLNILFGLSIFYVAEMNFKVVVPFFLADLGHSKSETAFCLSMMAASDIVARVVLPPLCDKIKISRRTMFMLFSVFLAISRSTLAEAGEWIALEVTLIISGFFRGATLINFMLVISEYCDNHLDKLPAAFGIHMVAKGLFIVALGPVIGLIRDMSQSYPLCIHAQTVMILLCPLAWSIEYTIVHFKSKNKQSFKEKENDT